MDIHLDQAQGRVPVTILRVHGDIDALNFQKLIDRIGEVYEQGARNVLLDMSEVGFMSSAGLVAIQGIIKILGGTGKPDTEHGWAAIHAVDDVRSGGMHEHFKILNPQRSVATSLDRVGFTDFIEIHTDEAEAVASF